MGKDEIVLSVVIPCFNDGRYLQEAVASAKLNRQGRHEIIVVNDGSTDLDTLAILQSLRDDADSWGVQVIDQPNRGLGAARNRGIAVSSGRYVLPLDSDNHIRAEYIDCGIEVLDRELDVDVVYADAEYFGERCGLWIVPNFDLRRLLIDNYIDACAVFRRSAWERCGGYDEHMPIQGREDWDLWIRIAMGGGRFYHVARPLFYYRVRTDSMTSKMGGSKQYEMIYQYVHAKRVEMSITDYMHALHSLDFVLSLVRNRPLHTLLVLFIRSYWPSLLAALPVLHQPNCRQSSHQEQAQCP